MRLVTVRLKIVVTSVLILLLSSDFCYAVRPIITSHTPQYSNGALSVNIQWQSENPVMKATLVTGQDQITSRLEDENRRIPGGFHGEALISAQVQNSMAGSYVSYSLQIEDEYRQKSEIVVGRFVLPNQAIPPGATAAENTNAFGINQGNLNLSLPYSGQAQQGVQLPAIPQQQVLPPNNVGGAHTGALPAQQDLSPPITQQNYDIQTPPQQSPGAEQPAAIPGL